MPWDPKQAGSTAQADAQYGTPVIGGDALTSNVVPSSAKTTNASSSAVATVGADRVNWFVDVTAVSGTSPTMTLTLQWSHDNTNWFNGDPVETFSAVSAATKVVKQTNVKAPFARLVWVLGGTTPSFTFAAHVYLTN